MPEEFPKKEVPKEDVFFIRHSKSAYKTYAATQKSGNPRAPFDPENQISPDLTEEGELLAKK
ncbi:MAG: hypothetical protein Q7R72_00295, partial [bacterium]|nr:hypothetical protein [bacterium]